MIQIYLGIAEYFLEKEMSTNIPFILSENHFNCIMELKKTWTKKFQPSNYISQNKKSLI